MTSLARRPLLRRGRRLVAALHDRAAALLRRRRRRRRLRRRRPRRRSRLRCASANASLTSDVAIPFDSWMAGSISSARVEALDRLVAVLEAGDVDGAQVDVGPRHDRVVVEPGLLARDQRVQQRPLGGVPLERVVVVERLLVHLNELVDRPPGPGRPPAAGASAIDCRRPMRTEIRARACERIIVRLQCLAHCCVMKNSTRRFFSRPAAVLLVSMGWSGP